MAAVSVGLDGEEEEEEEEKKKECSDRVEMTNTKTEFKMKPGLLASGCEEPKAT